MFGRNKNRAGRKRMAKHARELRRKGDPLSRAVAEFTTAYGQAAFPRYSKHGRRHR